MQRRMLATLLLASSLPLQTAYAQEETNKTTAQKDEDVAELNAVQVQGAEVSGPEITTEKLLKVPGAGNDPLKAIEALPGVVLGGFGPFSIPAIRGSSPRDNIYITDFIPVGYVFHNDGNSTYNANLVENFSLKAGAWGPEYSNAIGAVLATKLRDPYREPLTTTLDLSFLRAGAMIEGALSEDSAFYLSYRRSLLEFYVESFIDEDELTFTEVPRNSDYQFKYHWQPTATTNVRLIATGAEDSVGIEFGPENDALETEPALAGGLDADTYYHSQGILVDTLFDNGTSSMFSLSRKEEKTDFVVGTLFDLDAVNYEYRFKNYYNTPLDNGDTLRYGFDLSQTDIDYTAAGLYSPCNDEIGETCDPASLGEPFGPLGEVLTINGAYSFIAYDWFATPLWEITLGLGNSYNDFNEQNIVQPRLSTRYELNPAWTLTAAVGRHSQFIREFRFIADELGNPELEQPDAMHYVVGFEHEIDESLSSKLEVYYKDIDKLVATNPAYTYDPNNTNNPEQPYLNEATGEAYGIEFLLNKNLTDKWYGWFSLAYSQTKRTNEITGKEIDFELDRPWIVNLVASYQKDERTTYGFKWRYQSGSLITPVEGAIPFDEDGNVIAGNPDPETVYIYDPIEGEPNSERLPAYHRLDFRMDYKLSARSDFYFEIINLYNRANVSDYSYNKDYSEREKVESLPTIFSVGAKLVF
ncbi:TonB-dependent receptor [Bermanella marisrubri]|uniref:Putative TonB-dependent receptor n=1 Tax=Bermanella marisrubri TaxID=207949 RepID=Q1N122_9GAMM|nr:TonB-dependent receptor [Bermanella marisrubri]EAT11852.1 putative TonB-dependent receptor [Oceanobacter sp. RED65] [Bermanella marisrubri]QIZ83068.1 TonB-dependent receptor [Bermanella marisrubri]